MFFSFLFFALGLYCLLNIVVEFLDFIEMMFTVRNYCPVGGYAVYQEYLLPYLQKWGETSLLALRDAAALFGISGAFWLAENSDFILRLLI